MKKELYQPMFRQEWELENCGVETDFWDIEEVKGYLDKGEIEKAIFYIRELYHDCEPSDADIQLRIAEKRMDLLKPSFEQFFRMNVYTYYDYYSELEYGDYKGVRKLIYLYVDYARFCYRCNKEILLAEEQEVTWGEVKNRYLALWYMLEKLLSMRSAEMEDYLKEKDRFGKEQQKTFWELQEENFEELFLKDTGISIAGIGFQLEEIDADRYEAMGVTLMNMVNEKNIQDVENIFNIICNIQKMHMAYKGQINE